MRPNLHPNRPHLRRLFPSLSPILALTPLLFACGGRTPSIEESRLKLSAEFACDPSQIQVFDDGTWDICGLQADRICRRQTGSLYTKPDTFLDVFCEMETTYAHKDHNLLITSQKRFSTDHACPLDNTSAYIAYTDALSDTPPDRFWIATQGCNQAAHYLCTPGKSGTFLPPICERESFQNENKIRAFERSAALFSDATACPIDDISTSGDNEPIDYGGFPFHDIQYQEDNKTFSLVIWGCQRTQPYTCDRHDPFATTSSTCTPATPATDPQAITSTHQHIIQREAKTLLNCTPEQTTASRILSNLSSSNNFTTVERLEGCGTIRDLKCYFPSPTSTSPNCNPINLREHAPTRALVETLYKSDAPCDFATQTRWQRQDPQGDRFISHGCKQSLEYQCLLDHTTDTPTCTLDTTKRTYDQTLLPLVTADFEQRHQCPAREIEASHSWLTPEIIRYEAHGCGDRLYWLCPPPQNLPADITLEALCEPTQSANIPKKSKPTPPANNVKDW